MSLSQKCQYALRGLFELAKHEGDGPVPVAEIAEAQAIPPRFLELILKQLKQTGWVESFRGIRGGYALAVSPRALRVGEVIRFIEGPLAPVRCIAGLHGKDCALRGKCAFSGLWERAEQAVSGVYDATTFQDLVEEERAAERRYVPCYSI
jgi:Rrf2 family protein